MATRVKQLAFPKPGATKEKEPVLMISAERMLIHYNQDHPGLKKPAQRVTAKITDHTGKLAIQSGWAGAAVAKDAITGHTAGMMLLRTRKTTITPDASEVEASPTKASKPQEAIKSLKGPKTSKD